MIDPSDRVKWVYDAGSKEELQSRYDQWAAEYDQDLENEFGYVAPIRAADMFARMVSSDAVVLDAGAGTGLVGLELAKRGFGTIDAIDLSRGCSKKRGPRASTAACARWTLPSGWTSRTARMTDAPASARSPTATSRPAPSMSWCGWSSRAGCSSTACAPQLLESHGFAAKHAELAAAGRLELLEQGDTFQGLPKGEPDLVYNIWAFRVL